MRKQAQGGCVAMLEREREIAVFSYPQAGVVTDNKQSGIQNEKLKILFKTNFSSHNLRHKRAL